MKFVGFPYSNPAWVMNPKTTLSPKARYGRGEDSLGMAADVPVTSRHKISRKVRTRGTMTDSAAIGSQPLVRRIMRGRRSNTDDRCGSILLRRRGPGKPELDRQWRDGRPRPSKLSLTTDDGTTAFRLLTSTPASHNIPLPRHDRANHLALPHCREARRWRHGCGLQSRRPLARSVRRLEIPSR